MRRSQTLLPLCRLLPRFGVRQQATQAAAKRLRTLSYALPRDKPPVTNISDAVSTIQSGSNVYIHTCACTPTELLEEMCAQVDAGSIQNLRLSHIIINGKTPWNSPKFYGKIRSNCLFIDATTRKMVNEGHADYTPIFLSDIARLYNTFTLPVDVALITVSRPDEHGYCTLGPSADCSIDAIRAAKSIIALVNDTCPRTFGDTIIHSSHLDAMVPVSRPVYFKEDSDGGISEIEQKIGKVIAENLVDDGATLQMGIGAIPDAALASMKHHKDLGVHTELVSDGVIDLIERNVITNVRKTVDPGKLVTSFAFGTKNFYKFIDNNSFFLFRSCGYTNDTLVIRKQNRMTAINSAIEIDLTGQVASDSIGTKFYSGFGGQVDFIYGTAMADDGEGRSIIALPSVTAKGQSKIVPFLNEGAGVVTTRGHVRYVVTEHGIAQLWGKSVRQRAYQLIHIAHPDHRESLEKAAFKRLKCMPSKD